MNEGDVLEAIDMLNRKPRKWLYMEKPKKLAITRHFVAQYKAAGREMVSSAEFDEKTPDWMPKVKGMLHHTLGTSWTAVLAEFGMEPPVVNQWGDGTPAAKKPVKLCECGQPSTTKITVICNSPDGKPSYPVQMAVCDECAAMMAEDRARLERRGKSFWTPAESREYRRPGVKAAA